VISDIRGKPPLSKNQLAAAATTLAGIPGHLMALLEPDPPLQPMCQQVVLAIIEFSKLGADQKAKRRKVFMNQIGALQEWIAQPGMRDDILRHPISC
jgi:hypothetical protein